MKTKDDFKNTVIKAVEKGDGKKIVEFYKKLGFKNKKGWAGDVESDNIEDAFYGAGNHTIKYEYHCAGFNVLPMSTIDDYGKEEVKLTFPRKMMAWDNEHSSKSLDCKVR